MASIAFGSICPCATLHIKVLCEYIITKTRTKINTFKISIPTKTTFPDSSFAKLIASLPLFNSFLLTILL